MSRTRATHPCYRFPLIEAFYADAGVLPRSLVDLLPADEPGDRLRRATQSRAGKLYLVEWLKPHVLETEQRQCVLWLCQTWNNTKPAERQVENIQFIHAKKEILSQDPPRRVVGQEANFPRP